MVISRTSARGHQRLAWLAVGLAAIVIILLGYWFLTRGPGVELLSPTGSTVTGFTGEGDMTTGTFQVRDGWAIHWESTGDRFAFAIRGDRDFGTVIDVDEPESGVTSPTGAGAFHLEITAAGPWSITIAQGE